MNKFTPTPPRGEQHHCAKLTAEQVREMRRLSWEYGLCTKCLAQLYGIRYQSAWKIIKCYSWKHV